MQEKLIQLFDRMNHLKVLVIGDVMADAYIRGKVERISPEAPVPVINTRTREVRLGGAANVALNLKALGAEVTLCTMVGNDSQGKELIQLIEKEGINSDGIVVSNERPSTIKTRVIAGGQHLLRIDDENDSPATPNEQNLLLKKALELVQNVDAVIFEDYDKGVIFKELISQVTAKANSRNIPITVDPKKRNFLDYKNVSLFKPNLKELKEGLKFELNPKTKEEVESGCQKVISDLGVKGVLLTLSENGMAILSENEFFHVPAMQRDIADVSGAGDTVISVATLCLAAGCILEQTLFLANLAGGLVCEYSGVVPIKKDQLLKEAIKYLA
jgi:rfaE bifunctional protein kinase chain/domain